MLAQVLIAFLIERAGGNASDADVANQPLGELHVVLDMLRRHAAPIDHDKEAASRLENFEADFLQNVDHAITSGLIARLQILVETEWQTERSRGSGLQRRGNRIGDELMRLVHRVD